MSKTCYSVVFPNSSVSVGCKRKRPTIILLTVSNALQRAIKIAPGLKYLTQPLSITQLDSDPSSERTHI